MNKSDLWRIRGLELWKQREQYGVTVEQMALGVGVSENRIKRLEKGLPVNDGFMMERTYIYFLEMIKRGVCPYSICINFEKSMKKTKCGGG